MRLGKPDGLREPEAMSGQERQCSGHKFSVVLIHAAMARIRVDHQLRVGDA